MKAVVLCSLAEVHEARLIRSILAREGCPHRVADVIVDVARRQDFIRLFEELVGKKAREFRQCSRYKGFWSDIDKIREFRNDFVHREPEKAEREPGQIPKDFGSVIRSASATIEPAFQELTNKALAEIGRKA